MMLQITPQMKILVALAPVDFRKGIDGLVQLCKATLQQDPMSGTVFAFRNRRATAMKVLVYDGQGYWLCQKHQLHVLLAAGNPQATAAAPDWRPVRPE